MSEKTLTLSIVIPVYNEERYLPACLNAIAKQTVKPDEVIVVDNNSTDKTVEIAHSYKFVTLLHEKRQHQAFAQKTGFDNASSDILGRIDGDSVLPKDWVKKVIAGFNNDQNLAALTGEADPYDIYLKKTGVFIFDLFMYVAGKVAGHQMLWGANCAIRKTAWQKIKNQVLQRADIWEDYDLAFCLAKLGSIRKIKNLTIGTSFRAVHQSPINQTRYQFRSIRTFYLRTGLLKATVFGIFWALVILVYPIIFVDQFILYPLFKRSKI